MHLLLTGVLPFLGHDHASAAAFVTCRRHNFHASIIPEFLSDEERVEHFCKARQQDQLKADKQKQYTNLYNLFVQTPLMQFSPSLIVYQNDCNESILQPLLETKYFTRTLQRCVVAYGLPITNDLLQGLSRVQSLTKLDVGWCKLEKKHLEWIINSFPSLETLSFDASGLSNTTISINAPPPPATKTLRSLTMRGVHPMFATEFVPHFPNLRKLALTGPYPLQELDLLPLSSSLPHLTDLSLEHYTLANADSLQTLVHLSSLQFGHCHVPDLSFLTQQINLPHLSVFCIDDCDTLSSSSFGPLSYAPNNLYALKLTFCHNFNNDCLQYLKNMVHVRKLDLSGTKITGESESFKTLMQKLNQLEELNLLSCRGIGNRGAIAEALYSTDSRLRVLILGGCNLVDDDLKGISALKNTLEVLDVSCHWELTNEALVHCKDLVKLKSLHMSYNDLINDLSPLKGCLNLEELKVSNCDELSDDSFRVFSEEPNSFPNLRVLDLHNRSNCTKLTEKVFEHLAKNNHLVYQLKELNVAGMFQILSSSSSTARNNLYQLKGLCHLCLSLGSEDPHTLKYLNLALMLALKNVERF